MFVHLVCSLFNASRKILSLTFVSRISGNAMREVYRVVFAPVIRAKIHNRVRGNKIASRRTRCRSGRSGNGWTKGLASRLKGSHPLLLPSHLSINHNYILSLPLLSFIITARDFIPTLEAVGRQARCTGAREKEEERRMCSNTRDAESVSQSFGAQRLL